MSRSPELVVIASLVVLAAMAGGAFAGWMLFRHVDVRMLLADQPATVRLPQPIRVSAEVHDALAVMIDGDIATTVPVDQTLQVLLKDTLQVMASVDSDVPIRMTVPIRASIPVDQSVHVDTRVEVDVLGQTLTLPVRGDIPVKTSVPVSLDVPVDQLVRIRFTAPTHVHIKDAVSVPLKADIAAVVPVHSEMSVPLRAPLAAEVRVPGELPVRIVRSELKVPLREVAFGVSRPAAKAGGQP